MSDQTIFSSRHAAAYLGYEDQSLRRSRMTGVLGGIAAPAYHRRDVAPGVRDSIIYTKADLDEFLARRRAGRRVVPTGD